MHGFLSSSSGMTHFITYLSQCKVAVLLTMYVSEEDLQKPSRCTVTSVFD